MTFSVCPLGVARQRSDCEGKEGREGVGESRNGIACVCIVEMCKYICMYTYCIHTICIYVMCICMYTYI